MTEALVVSNTLLWCVVVALCVVVVALLRQIGVLHERIAPVGALAVAHGPAVGDAVSPMHLTDEAGRRLAFGGEDPDRNRTLLFFLSPTCPVCETLLPTLRRVATEESPGLRVIFASDGDPEEHRAFRAAHGLADETYVLSRELGMYFEVAKLPFAVLIDAEGVVRAKGIVNTREHLESLFAAHQEGVASIQDFLERREQSSRQTTTAEALR